MDKLNYDELSGKIKEYYKSGVNCQITVIDDQDKARRLSQLIEYDKESMDIGSFKMILCNDINVFEFELINPTNGSKTNNIILTKNNKAALRIEKSELSKMNIPYQKETFSIYDENAQVTSKISYENISNSLNIDVMNKRISRGRTYNKKYTFYYNDDTIVALKVDDEMHLMIEGGFLIGLDAAYKLIGSVNTKITNRINESVGIDNVKEYHIGKGKRV